MRIKIIGDNNCARATRHLLMTAGFAVTEFLPSEAAADAPHSGYAITIDLAPAPLTPDQPSKPDQATHGQPATAREEALPLHGGASSPAFVQGSVRGCIHFDSVDSALEGAILRHVTQLAAAPVIVDRPGGVVHSERELRIVVPMLGDETSGDGRMDEAAAVAVEYGVLRGLLDLTSSRPKSSVADTQAEKPVVGPEGSLSVETKSAEDSTVPASACRSKKKWWVFGAVLVVHVSLLFIGGAQASPRRGGLGSTQAIEARGADGAYLHMDASLAAADPQGQFATGQAVKIFDGTNTLIVDPCKAQTKQFASINQTANAQLVAGTASKKIYICSIHVVVAATANVALVEGTGTVCATSTAGVGGFGGSTAATGWNFMANGGIVLGSGDAAVGAEVTSADNLCLFNSGSGQVSGGISYVVQ